MTDAVDHEDVLCENRLIQQTPQTSVVEDGLDQDRAGNEYAVYQGEGNRACGADALRIPYRRKMSRTLREALRLGERDASSPSTFTHQAAHTRGPRSRSRQDDRKATEGSNGSRYPR